LTLLSTHGLVAGYGDFQALFGIDFAIDAQEVVAIIGANGAGKSTFLKTVCGLIAAPRDSVMFEGKPIGGLPANDVVARGIALVPEGRRLFPSLSVEENIAIGAYRRRPGPWSLARVYGLFPQLKERRASPATALSGGQQQMVAIGRALMANPRLLLCDEVSLGLAPVVVKDVYAALPRILEEGTAIVVVEQDIHRALAVAQRVYCIQKGRVSLCGAPAAFSRDDIRLAYFGL
jgi:branched-chain amino acid transport system ATP-binding protein